MLVTESSVTAPTIPAKSGLGSLHLMRKRKSMQMMMDLRHLDYRTQNSKGM